MGSAVLLAVTAGVLLVIVRAAKSSECEGAGCGAKKEAAEDGAALRLALLGVSASLTSALPTICSNRTFELNSAPTAESTPHSTLSHRRVSESMVWGRVYNCSLSEFAQMCN